MPTTPEGQPTQPEEAVSQAQQIPEGQQIPGQMPVNGQYAPNAAPVDPNGQPVDPNAPFDPSAPVNASQPMMPGMPAAPAKKKVSKGLIIGLSVGAGVLIVVLVVVAILVSQMRITSDDYSDAQSKATQTYSALSNADSDFTELFYNVSGGKVETDEVKDELADVQKKYDTYEKHNDELAGMRALKDSDVSQAYDKYVAKTKSYDTYRKNVDDAMPTLAAVYDGCSTDDLETYASNLKDVVKSLNSYMKSCKAAVDDLSKVKDKTIAQYGIDLSSKLTAMQKDIDVYASLGTGDDIYSDDGKYKKYRLHRTISPTSPATSMTSIPISPNRFSPTWKMPAQRMLSTMSTMR
jgi:uncharacterized protein (UPF0333 family)